ncbi:MAG: DUF5666 domain-containing protein [Acidobacteriota bacterium]|nr:DUF5666 domain-containing protein [Acidobacteriota bacterium]
MRATFLHSRFGGSFIALTFCFLAITNFAQTGGRFQAPGSGDFEFTGIIQTLPNAAGLVGDWKVAGRIVHVTSGTQLKPTDGQFVVGKFVRVEGCKQNNNSVNGKEIESKFNPGGGAATKFFGNIEKLPSTTGRIGDWNVAGRTVHVGMLTVIEQREVPLAIGVRVEVEGIQLPDGSVDAELVETEAEPGGGPFDFTGTIENLSGGLNRLGEWAISGRKINVTNATRIRQEQGQIGVGVTVQVRSLVRQNGSLDALEIETRFGDNVSMVGRFAEFYGTIESLVQQNKQLAVWTVSGRRINITAMTVIERADLGIAVGARVEVKGIVQADTSIDATRIVLKSSAGSQPNGVLYGKVEMLPATVNLIGDWRIAGKTVHVTAATGIERKYDQIALGAFGEVFGSTAADGSINAARIEAKQGPGNGAFTSFDSVATVSAASYREENSAESIVSAFGNNLASGTTIALSQPLPLNLWNVSVLIDGRQARLFFVSPNQINYLIPADVPSGLANVVVTSQDQIVSQGTIVVSNVAPSLFTADASGQGPPAGLLLRIKANGEQVYESLVQFDVTQSKLVPAPIIRRPDEQLYLILFGSGLRYAPNSDGNETNGVAERVEATLGDVGAPVVYAGIAPGYVGLEQINVQIPDAAVSNPNTIVTIRVRDVLNNLKQANSVTVFIQ